MVGGQAKQKPVYVKRGAFLVRNLNRRRHLHQKFWAFKRVGNVLGEKFDPPEAPAPGVPGFYGDGGHFVEKFDPPEAPAPGVPGF